MRVCVTEHKCAFAWMYVSIQLCYKPPVFPCVFQYDYVLRIIVWQHAGRYSQTEHALALTNHSLCTIGFETAALEMGFLAPNRQQFRRLLLFVPFWSAWNAANRCWEWCCDLAAVRESAMWFQLWIYSLWYCWCFVVCRYPCFFFYWCHSEHPVNHQPHTGKL